MNCLTANKSSLRAKPPLEQLTSGMVNAVRCQITFSEDWTGLTKIAVFSNGRASVDIPEMEWEENVIPIPPEMTARPGVTVRLGIYGTDGGSVVLPTVWCSLGSVQVGADPSGAANLQPAAPVWERVLARLNEIDGGTVLSVNGMTGTVNLTAADVGASTKQEVKAAIENALSDIGIAEEREY